MKVTDNSILGIIYTLILAVIIAVFVGVTLNTFYPTPDYPDKDVFENVEHEDREPTKAEIAEDEAQMNEYEDEMQGWSQIASVVILVSATALVALGLFMSDKMPIIPNGILLGGLFTLFYGVILGFQSNERYLIFGVTTASLVVIISAGYLKFVKPDKK
ncbi:MAG: hypothetical protein PHW75_02055 [Patescibacteria group bacterium]|nr:hypothetical protein [Patescibacteria group bacterium]